MKKAASGSIALLCAVLPGCFELVMLCLIMWFGYQIRMNYNTSKMYHNENQR